MMKFESISIRPTAESDIDTVLAMERSDDNTPYIRQWARGISGIL
jgi:hypothetical protein